MAHFAEIDQDNNVLTVIVINNEAVDDLPFPESEPIGQQFIASLGIQGTWLQCSYNSNFRGRYPGEGYKYGPTLGEYGAFFDPNYIPPEPTSLEQ